MIKQLKELAWALCISLLASFFIIYFIFQVVHVDGQSMEPTLHNNDRLVVEKITYYFRNPAPKDIVVIKYPSDLSQKFIKRVIGKSGDKIKVYNNKLYVNGDILEEPYILEKEIGDFEEQVVPENAIFVMGDNRNHSRDSRSPDVGFVDKKLVVGKAALRLYPFKLIGRLN